MPDTTADALVNAMNAQSERSVLGQVGLGIGSTLGFEEARRVRDDRSLSHDVFRAQTEATEASGEVAIAVEKIGAANSLAIEKTAAAGILESNKNAFSLALQANLVDLRRDVATGFAQGRNDSIMFANQARTDAIQFQAATNLAIEKASAAGILLATQNQAATMLAFAQQSRERAECCCEQKELTRAEAGQTRDLINATTLQATRDALVDSKNETAIAKILAGKIVG